MRAPSSPSALAPPKPLSPAGAGASRVAPRPPPARVYSAGGGEEIIEEAAMDDRIEAEAETEASPCARMGAVLLVLVLTVVYGGLIGVKAGGGAAWEFFAAYLVEQSLSLDNLFVFLVIFQHWRVAPRHQTKVLLCGLALAMPLRAAMLLFGVEVVEHFRWIILIFAAILVVSGVKILKGEEDEGEADDFSKHSVVRIARALVGPRCIAAKPDGGRLLTRVNGQTLATPMLLCLICIELSDCIFAVDSIPAVIGITDRFAYVFPSNVLAIMTVRALYSLIAKLVADLDYLQYASGLVLIYVGVTMVLDFFGIEIPTWMDLVVIAALLAAGTALSLCTKDADDAEGTSDAEDNESQVGDADVETGDDLNEASAGSSSPRENALPASPRWRGGSNPDALDVRSPDQDNQERLALLKAPQSLA